MIIISTVFGVNKHCCFRSAPLLLYVLGLEEDEKYLLQYEGAAVYTLYAVVSDV